MPMPNVVWTAIMFLETVFILLTISEMFVMTSIIFQVNHFQV